MSKKSSRSVNQTSSSATLDGVTMETPRNANSDGTREKTAASFVLPFRTNEAIKNAFPDRAEMIEDGILARARRDGIAITTDSDGFAKLVVRTLFTLSYIKSHHIPGDGKAQKRDDVVAGEIVSWMVHFADGLSSGNEHFDTVKFWCLVRARFEILESREVKRAREEDNKGA
jgi:hypothetical protein